MTPTIESQASFETEDREARALVRDLHSPRPLVYWLDFLFTSALGWTAFVLAARSPLSLATLLFAAVAVFALYRGLCFLHEITHFTQRSMRGFETVWNALIGFPLLMPSFIYVGVHQAHHSLKSYGTSDDPEYLPFAQSTRMTLVFALESFLIPVALALRFLILSPIGLVAPPFQRWLTEHASALTMNFSYRREVTPVLLSRVRAGSMLILFLWAAAIWLLPVRVFALWFAVVSVASFINTLRTLAAHRYEGEGEPLDRSGQLSDSIDVPGRLWTELWAPVGLRYHALHHYFPGVPYHNLPEAHRRLVKTLPVDSVYRRTSSSSLLASLTSLVGGRRKVR